MVVSSLFLIDSIIQSRLGRETFTVFSRRCNGARGKFFTNSERKLGALLRGAATVLDQMNQLRSKVVESKRSLSGEIRIACSNSVAQTLLPRLLVDLEKKFPGIQPSLVVANARRTRERLVMWASLTHESAQIPFTRN